MNIKKINGLSEAQRRFHIWRQYLLPQHALSKLAGCLSQSKIPWLKNYLIRYFIKRYPVVMNDAVEPNPYAYHSYHDFFTRRLKPALRPVDPTPNGICSPCDGTISQIGKIEDETLLQAKDRTFTLSALLGDQAQATLFKNGRFITIYLAPIDYHRVHMPCQGTLAQLRYLPGKLFSVNPLTTEHVDNLFARNERVITFYKNNYGSFAIILVGAMLVGSIYTRWGGTIKPHRAKKMVDIHYPQTNEQYIKLSKGEEMGYFSLGSTVILLFAENVHWEYDFTQQSRIVVGQRIGHFSP